MVRDIAPKLKVVIVGAGIGGLACAIACRRQDLDVIVLERAPEFQPIGAGIQIPSNASRVMRHLGLYDKLTEHGGVVIKGHTMRAYNTGKVLARKQAGDKMVEIYGSEWLVIHRARYQKLLLDEAVRLGAQVRTGCDVVGADSSLAGPVVKLRDGEIVTGDVVIGADGLWSQMRNIVLGYDSPSSETGDLAYRGTFSAEQLRNVGGEDMRELLEASDVQVWLGPDKHVVFYPVNDKTEFNLVLLRPDNLPPNARNEVGSLDEMRETFQGWDPRLTRMIAQLQTALKWKLCHHTELKSWIKGSIALMGDSSHPTLPYQAQGAAMAVEDGAVIGTLLGRLQACPDLVAESNRQQAIGEILNIYERLRKQRTTVNVKGAVECQDFYHLRDGEDQIYRDHLLERFDKSEEWPAPCRWNWGDAEYQKSLLGFDIIADANRQFDRWRDSAKT